MIDRPFARYSTSGVRGVKRDHPSGVGRTDSIESCVGKDTFEFGCSWVIEIIDQLFDLMTLRQPDCASPPKRRQPFNSQTPAVMTLFTRPTDGDWTAIITGLSEAWGLARRVSCTS